MNIHFEKYKLQDEEQLALFLCSQEWAFHEKSQVTLDEAKKDLQAKYNSSGVETFWIVNEESVKIGFLRIYDLEDETPLFDLRIGEEMRGQGIGTKALLWMMQYIFETYPHIRRIEGYTREDNVAMQRTFEKCGFVKEAQHRKSWRGADGTYYDSIGYGILREDLNK